MPTMQLVSVSFYTWGTCGSLSDLLNTESKSKHMPDSGFRLGVCLSTIPICPNTIKKKKKKKVGLQLQKVPSVDSVKEKMIYM